MTFNGMLADNSTMYDSPTTMWLKKPSARSVHASETSQTLPQPDSVP
jgi:hypothetical protein